jgi:hypothetical protein
LSYLSPIPDEVLTTPTLTTSDNVIRMIQTKTSYPYS